MLPSRQPQRSTSTTTQPRTLQALQGRPKGSMVQRSAAGFFGFPELSKLHQAGIEAKLNASARLVLFNLAVYVNPDVGWKAWPQLKTLAEGTSLSERTVRRALRSLEKAQICRRIPHKKGRNANGLCEQLLPLLPLAQLNPNGGQPDPPRRTTGADDGGQPRPMPSPQDAPDGGQRMPPRPFDGGHWSPRHRRAKRLQNAHRKPIFTGKIPRYSGTPDGGHHGRPSTNKRTKRHAHTRTRDGGQPTSRRRPRTRRHRRPSAKIRVGFATAGPAEPETDAVDPNPPTNRQGRPHGQQGAPK